MSKISREALLEMAREAMERSVVAMRENAIAEATTPPSKLKSATQFDKTECFLEHFAELVAAAEREVCARVCDEESGEWWFADNGNQAAKDCAAAIRARGEK